MRALLSQLWKADDVSYGKLDQTGNWKGRKRPVMAYIHGKIDRSCYVSVFFTT